MNRRQTAEARYDTMPASVAEQAYGDPLKRRLAEAEGEAWMMERMIREAIWLIRYTRSESIGVTRRNDIRMMWKHRRIKQAEAKAHRVLIAQRDAQDRLSAAE